MRANAAPDTQALRSWQRRALVRYLAAQPRDFLTVATPGSGKTAFALRVAGELLADGAVEQITVVVADRTPQVAVGAGGRGRRHRTRSEVQQLRRTHVVGVSRRRRHLHHGKPHGWIHKELRRICGGPPIAAATSDQLKARIEAVRELRS